MPTPYELMDLYRTWWRANYSTTPNSQATIIAAAWAEHVLATYRAGEEAEIVNHYERLSAQHPGQAVYHPGVEPAAPAQPVGEAL
jgi:hypothetical protein